MAYTLDMMSEPISSARSVRSQYRQAEANAARLRLLQAAGMAFWHQGASAWAEVLTQALAFSALDSGAVLSYEAGVLRVCAAAGQAPPTGTRMTPQGALAAALKPPARPLLRQNIPSSLAVGRPLIVALELLLPLCFGGHICGLLALTGTQTAALPEAADLDALQALAGLLASAVRPNLGKSAAATKNAVTDAALDTLTPRERQVFALLPRGLTNAVMAEQLGIAAGTVKVHVERILSKLGLHDRTQAAVCAAQQGYQP